MTIPLSETKTENNSLELLLKNNSNLNIFERELLNRIPLESLFKNKKFKSLKIPIQKGENSQSEQRKDLFKFTSFCTYFLINQPLNEINEFFNKCLDHISQETTIFEYIIHLVNAHYPLNFQMFNYIENSIITYANSLFHDSENRFHDITNFSYECNYYLLKKDKIEQEIAKRNELKIQEAILQIKSGRIHH